MSKDIIGPCDVCRHEYTQKVFWSDTLRDDCGYDIKLCPKCGYHPGYIEQRLEAILEKIEINMNLFNPNGISKNNFPETAENIIGMILHLSCLTMIEQNRPHPFPDKEKMSIKIRLILERYVQLVFRGRCSFVMTDTANRAIVDYIFRG